MARQYKPGEFATVPNIRLLKDVTPVEGVVFVYLCWRQGKDKTAFPSYKTIAEDTGISRSTAIRAVEGLENSGWIERVKRDRGNGSQASNEYRIMQLDSSKNSRGVVSSMTPPSVTGDTTPSVMDDTPLTITNKNNNQVTIKTKAKEDIERVFILFETIFGIQQQRNRFMNSAASKLLKQYSLDTLEAMFQTTATAQKADKYCPWTTDIEMFLDKIPRLKDYFGKKTQQHNLIDYNF